MDVLPLTDDPERLMSYDAFGRLITKVQQNTGGTPILTMVDTYDAAGRKTKQVKNSTTTTFTYDNADRLLSQQRPGGKSVTYTLDTVSNLKTIKAEGAQPVTVQDGPTGEASPALWSLLAQSAGHSG